MICWYRWSDPDARSHSCDEEECHSGDHRCCCDAEWPQARKGKTRFLPSRTAATSPL
jgi:hypothetical protein